jgi:intein/homing endonuclease
MMWSLYRKKGDEDCEEGGLFNFTSEKLEPLKFSNGKSQEDVVKEALSSIQNGKRAIFIRGVCGSGKCLDGNTRIFCRPCRDNFFRYHKIKDIVGKNGKIISLNKLGKLTYAKFINVRKTGFKKIYCLTTASGKTISLSENHPLLTLNEKGIKWEKLSKLNKDSYICIPNKLNLNPQDVKISDEEIKILGHLIVDTELINEIGQQYRNINRGKINFENGLYTNFLKRFSDYKFILGPKKIKNKENINNKENIKKIVDKLCISIEKYNLLENILTEISIPRIIFNLSEEKLNLFIKTLFSRAGKIYKKESGDKKIITIEYSSISKIIIQDISLLLNRLGIQHKILLSKFKKDISSIWKIEITEKESLNNYLDKIGFIGKKQIDAIKILGDFKNYNAQNMDKLPARFKEYLINEKHVFTEIYNSVDCKKKEIINRNLNDKIRCHKPDCLRIFEKIKTDFLREDLRKINAYLKEPDLEFICSEDIIWDKIKSITFIKKDEVYDLEVPNENNFIADGILVHNSAMALNLASHFKKSSVVVPIKSLQEQYEKDYTQKNFINKPDGKMMKISIIKGRNNFECSFCNGRADDKDLPCNIEIRERNFDKIKSYIQQNNLVNLNDFSQISDVRRFSIAPACPYWSPLIPAEMKMKALQEAKKKKYISSGGKEYAFFQRTPGCKYYEQYNSYVDSDVLVFNSLKYLIELSMGRKPKTEIEIIDECDDFLDDLASERKINLNRLLSSISNIFPEDSNQIQELKDMIHYLNQNINNPCEKIEKLKESYFSNLIEKILANPNLASDDEDNYYNSVLEICRAFEQIKDETYTCYEKKEQENQTLFGKKNQEVSVNLVSINLSGRLKEIMQSTEVLIFMSGTLHSEQVLRDMFGLKNFIIIDAETKSPGMIRKVRTGLEKNCKYANFSNGTVTRKQYLEALEKCIEIAKPPILIHVSSFGDLPSEQEKQEFNLKKIISKEKLFDLQKNAQQEINRFKNRQTEILYTTKCSRGIDFPGEQCNSIIITKFPYPNIQGLFWKILKQHYPEKFMEFYMDRSNRELIQKVARGVRFKEDMVFLLSPDSRVLDFKFN